MNKIILFSPVGGTDPISLTNCCDGSMLHICRHYKPDKVMLYMSKEMIEFQEEDDRYRYCLDRLVEKTGHKMEYEIIERKELTKVHEFNTFYDDFRTIIEKTYKEMDPSDTLLLNISSGTPAMKSGLLVLQTLGEFPAKLIQVTTPEKKINEHIHKGYDVEMLWALNEDNLEGSENRCREVTCPSLSKIKKEEIIKKHILVYDYRAALGVVESLSEEATVLYKDWLKLATSRAMLDFVSVDEIIKKRNYQCLPIRTSSGRKCFEYALNVELRLRRKEYADYIRAITPLVVDLFEMILKKQCKCRVDDYCDGQNNDREKRRRWSETKLQGTEVGEILKESYKGKFNYGDIYSEHLKILVCAMSNDAHLKKLVDNVRSVEFNIRNLAAHEIISVSDEMIKKRTGFSAEKIMNMIKELFNYTGIPVKPEYWDSYDEMNEKILECMSIEK